MDYHKLWTTCDKYAKAYSKQSRHMPRCKKQVKYNLYAQLLEWVVIQIVYYPTLDKNNLYSGLSYQLGFFEGRSVRSPKFDDCVDQIEIDQCVARLIRRIMREVSKIGVEA